MKLLIKLLAIPIILSATVACNKKDDSPSDQNVIFKATLDGAQEVPANASTATGSATLTFNTVTKIFTITVTHTIAAPTNAHIHKGAPGISAAPVFPFASFTSPITYTSQPLSAAEEADLFANLYYVNIHSAAPFGNGEIRGQLIKQ